MSITLSACLDSNGELDPMLYMQYMESRRKRRKEGILQMIFEEENQPSPEPKQKRKRGKRGYYDDDEGKWVDYDPRKSSWYVQYVLRDQRSKKQLRKFRRRFRLPYASFQEFLLVWQERKNGSKDMRKKTALEGLVHHSNYCCWGAYDIYMGRGWTFDDIEEATYISEEVHRVFFHEFINVGSTVMFEKWVSVPKTPADIHDCMHEYAEAGMNGAIASTDGVHIIHEKIAAKLKNSHLSHKAQQTTRVFNVSVNHRRRILATSPSCPGSWNDKSVVKFDKFICDILRAGRLYEDVEYELYDDHGIPHRFRGAWVLSDNGYLDWSCTVPPMKDTGLFKDIRWSKWLESMRKDVECTFGILKGRWRILKTGIRLKHPHCCDKIWKTCCAFHNFLLEVDGLDKRWREGVPSRYAGELGWHDTEDNARCNGNRQYDCSGVGFGDDDCDDTTDVQFSTQTAQHATRHIRTSYSLDKFRGLLINHFEYRDGSVEILNGLQEMEKVYHMVGIMV